MGVRAKFTCRSVTPSEHGPDYGSAVHFDAVYGDGTDNAQWSKWTPSGHLTMQITNPNALVQFEPGKDYFLDFSPAQ